MRSPPMWVAMQEKVLNYHHDESLESIIRVLVDSQIWHLLRSTGLTGQADRSGRSGLYSPRRIRVFVKSPYVILLVKGYVFPGL